MSVDEIRKLQLRIAGSWQDIKSSRYFWGGLNEENLLESVVNYPLHSINVRMPQTNSQMFYQDNLLLLLEREYKYFLQSEQNFFREISDIAGYSASINFPSSIGDDSGNAEYRKQLKVFFKNFLNTGEYNIIKTLMTSQEMIYGKVKGVYKKDYIEKFGNEAQKNLDNKSEVSAKITDSQMKKLFKVNNTKNGQTLVFRNKNYLNTLLGQVIGDNYSNILFSQLMNSLGKELGELKMTIGVGKGRKESFTYSKKQINAFNRWLLDVFFPKVIDTAKTQLSQDGVAHVESKISEAGFSLTVAPGVQINANNTEVNDRDPHQYALSLIGTFEKTILNFLSMQGQKAWKNNNIRPALEDSFYQFCKDDNGIINLFQRQEANQIKAFLGEFAANLLKLLFPNQKSQALIKGTIIGEIKDTKGESLAVDVMLKVGPSLYGIQVKRYSDTTYSKSHLNSTSIQVKSTDALKRYLGADTEFFQFLEANAGFFGETGLYTGIYEDDIYDVEYNLLYAHYPSFMRLQQENLADAPLIDDIKNARSNFYLVKTELVPASFFLYAVYKEIVKAYKMADAAQFFQIESKKPDLRTPTVQSNKHSISIENAIEKSNCTIIFKGIRLNSPTL